MDAVVRCALGFIVADECPAARFRLLEAVLRVLGRYEERGFEVRFTMATGMLLICQ